MTDIDQLFKQALELPEDERQKWLCELPPESRDLLERVLKADQQVQVNDHFLNPIAGHLDSCSVDTHSQKLAMQETGRFSTTLQQAEKDDSAEYLEVVEPTADMDALGQIGDYQIRSVLGTGGMGYVFEAHDSKLDRSVAIKVMKPSVASDRLSRERFVREARAVAKIKHPNIVTIHQVDPDNKHPFLVMELLEGESLKDRLARVGSLSQSEAIGVGQAIAIGIAEAHKHGLVHRDIKPDNIWLEVNGNVKVLDFGLVCEIEGDALSLTQSGAVVGTPRYMSPEQAAGQVLDHRTDLFSLGSVLFESVSGEPAFDAPNLTAVLLRIASGAPKDLTETCPAASPGFAALVHSLLAKSPEQRPDSASVVALQLTALATESCENPTANSVLADSSTTSRRNLLGWLTAAAATLLAGIAITITTKRGTVAIQSDGDLSGVAVIVSKGGEEIALLDENNQWSAKVFAGEYMLEIKGGSDSFKLIDNTLTVSRFGKNDIKIQASSFSESDSAENSIETDENKHIRTGSEFQVFESSTTFLIRHNGTWLAFDRSKYSQPASKDFLRVFKEASSKDNTVFLVHEPSSTELMVPLFGGRAKQKAINEDTWSVGERLTHIIPTAVLASTDRQNRWLLGFEARATPVWLELAPVDKEVHEYVEFSRTGPEFKCRDNRRRFDLRVNQQTGLVEIDSDTIEGKRWPWAFLMRVKTPDRGMQALLGSEDWRWSEPAELPAHLSPGYPYFLSADGKVLLYSSSRGGGEDIWSSKRQTLDLPWEAPEKLGTQINTSNTEWSPALSADQNELFYHKGGDVGAIYRASWNSALGTWGTGERIGKVDSSKTEQYPLLSQDGLELVVTRLFPCELVTFTRDSRKTPFKYAHSLESEDTLAARVFSRDRLQLLVGNDRTKNHHIYTRRYIKDQWAVSSRQQVQFKPANAESITYAADAGRLIFRHDGRLWESKLLASEAVTRQWLKNHNCVFNRPTAIVIQGIAAVPPEYLASLDIKLHTLQIREHITNEVAKTFIQANRNSLKTIQLVRPVVPQDLMRTLAFASCVTELELESGRLESAESLNLVDEMDSLTSLVFDAFHLSDEGFQAVSNLRRAGRLRRIFSHGSGISDKGLRDAQNLVELESLTIWNSRIRGPGLVALQGLRKLRTLSLRNNPLADSSLETIAKISSLNTLGLEASPITGGTLNELLSLKNLESLNISETQIGDDSIPDLIKMQTLKQLNVKNTRISEIGATRLKDGLPSCSVLTGNGK